LRHIGLNSEPETAGERRAKKRFRVKLPLTVRWTNGSLIAEAQTECQDINRDCGDSAAPLNAGGANRGVLPRTSSARGDQKTESHRGSGHDWALRVAAFHWGPETGAMNTSALKSEDEPAALQPINHDSGFWLCVRAEDASPFVRLSRLRRQPSVTLWSNSDSAEKFGLQDWRLRS